MIDSPALGWGIHIDRVEIKDVVLPDSMKRSMSRQAEAERERRARVITADGELQASEKLAQAAQVMAQHPAALQLRLLETVVEVAAEKNSTLVLPFPVELLRFLESATPSLSAVQGEPPATSPEPTPVSNGANSHGRHIVTSKLLPRRRSSSRYLRIYRFGAGAPSAACQLDQRRTVIAMTGPFNGTDWY